MILKNLEKNEEFYIPENWYENRKKGISAFIRVKNEEEFIKPCILSVADFFDEIVIALNRSTDNTRSILESLKMDKIKIYDYPFKLHPNGPTHKECKASSLKDNSYYYNWLLSKTTYSHVCKWDGDMVALEALNKIRDQVFEYATVSFHGLNMAGTQCRHLSRTQPRTAAEPRFFNVTKETCYLQGPTTQYLHKGKGKNKNLSGPMFLHFKSVKNIKSASAIWPDNWENMPTFKRLIKRREPGTPYKGEIPEALKDKYGTAE